VFVELRALPVGESVTVAVIVPAVSGIVAVEPISRPVQVSVTVSRAVRFNAVPKLMVTVEAVDVKLVALNAGVPLVALAEQPLTVTPVGMPASVTAI
jgi:hypothetical protein